MLRFVPHRTDTVDTPLMVVGAHAAMLFGSYSRCSAYCGRREQTQVWAFQGIPRVGLADPWGDPLTLLTSALSRGAPPGGWGVCFMCPFLAVPPAPQSPWADK